MKLAELSPLYEDSARQLRRRLTELQPMLRQCRQLARLTAHYYDRSDRSYDPFRL